MRQMCVLLSVIIGLTYFPTFIDSHQENMRNLFFHSTQKKGKITLTGILFLALSKINDRETGSFYSFKIFTKCLLGATPCPRSHGYSGEQDRQGPAALAPARRRDKEETKESRMLWMLLHALRATKW